MSLKEMTKTYLPEILRIALPVAGQNLLISGLSMVDTLMIGQLGETALAASALGAQCFFILLLFLFGVSGGSSSFISQFWGRKDFAGIRQTQSLCLLIACAGAGAVTAWDLIDAEGILSFFSNDSQVIALGTPFLTITALSYLPAAVSLSFGSALRTLERPDIPMKISFVSLTGNALFNYLLIFGKAGFPELGITGAAIATTGSRILEMILTLWAVYIPRKKADSGRFPCPAAVRFGDFLKIPGAFRTKYIKIVSPVIFNEVGWVLGITAYKYAYAQMGTGNLAAINISETITRLLTVSIFGTSQACVIIIGKKIGSGKPEEARALAKLFLLLSPVQGLLTGLIIFGSAPLAVSLYNITPEVRALSLHVLWISAAMIQFRVISLHIIIGILRAGGDTRYSLYLDVLSLWLLGVPLVFAGAFIFRWPLEGVYALLAAEEGTKMIFGLMRVKSGKWLHNLTE